MKRVARHIAAALATAAGLLAGGCYTPNQTIVVDINPNEWLRPISLFLNNADTTTLRDLSFFVRSDQRLSGDTLTLRIAVETPDTLHYQEPFRLVIPRNNTPAARRYEAVIPYRNRVRFPCMGTYRITLVPTRPIQGIEAIGINIVKSK